MTWAKLDDGAAEHRKAKLAGLPAWGWWCAALCYAARYETNGRIPKDETDLVWSGRDCRGIERHVARLVDVGLLEDAGDAWVLHDWQDYQLSPAEIAAKREKWRDKKRRQRASSPGESPGEYPGESPESPALPRPPPLVTTNGHRGSSEIEERARGGSRPRKGSNSSKAMKGTKRGTSE